MSSYSNSEGKSPRILLGTTSAQERGLLSTARKLRDAGLEVIYLGARLNSQSILSAAEQEDADAVCTQGSGEVASAEIAVCDTPEEVLQKLSSGEIVAKSNTANDSPQELLQKAKSGDDRAMGKLLSLAETDPSSVQNLSADSPAAGSQTTGNPATSIATVGIAGLQGSGKSALIVRLIEEATGVSRRPGRPKPPRADAPKVAVLAVDATSPKSGGALLGDRVRLMSDHEKLANLIFFRSFASQRTGEGNSKRLQTAVKLLESAGYGLVFIEATGMVNAGVAVVGSAIASGANTTVAVLSPNWGDAVQANKAGVLESADIFAINKCDLHDTESERRDLERMLDMGFDGSWRPPVLECSAATGDGTGFVWDFIAAHQKFQMSNSVAT